jgi:hypothetical protein
MADGELGYSGTPLPTKLGIKAGHRVILAGAPPTFELGGMPEDVEVDASHAAGGDLQGELHHERYDVVLGFCPDRATLLRCFDGWKAALDPASALWIAWPKKASRVPTDLTEAAVREHGLTHGLVDVKICAVDAVWSGLKLVYRTADRPTVSRTQA